MDVVNLREVARQNVTPICKLELADGQERFVAHPAVTIAQAHYEDEAILRAIYAGDVHGLCRGRRRPQWLLPAGRLRAHRADQEGERVLRLAL